jgi:aspartyl protease family protein
MSAQGTLFLAACVAVGAIALAPRLSHVQTGAVARRDAAQPRAAATEVLDETSAGQTIRRSSDGHFYVDAEVNGARIHFMVDTGASIVALTREDAQRAAIPLPEERVSAIGAGGEIDVAPVTIERMTMNGRDVRDVGAVVAERLPVSLLGQSFLSRLEAVEINGERMTLR